MKNFSKAYREEGYTLVEQMVALAIFLAVLLPTSSFFLFIDDQMSVKEAIIARSLAQREMELTLLNKTYTNKKKKLPESGWVVRKQVNSKENIVRIKIEVFESKERNVPLIEIKTIRHVLEQ